MTQRLPDNAVPKPAPPVPLPSRPWPSIHEIARHAGNGVRRALLIAQALDQNWAFWDGAQVQVVPARTVPVPAEWIPGDSPAAGTEGGA